jgi:hypothetical protein
MGRMLRAAQALFRLIARVGEGCLPACLPALPNYVEGSRKATQSCAARDASVISMSHSFYSAFSRILCILGHAYGPLPLPIPKAACLPTITDNCLRQPRDRFTPLLQLPDETIDRNREFELLIRIIRVSSHGVTRVQQRLSPNRSYQIGHRNRNQRTLRLA